MYVKSDDVRSILLMMRLNPRLLLSLKNKNRLSLPILFENQIKLHLSSYTTLLRFEPCSSSPRTISIG